MISIISPSLERYLGQVNEISRVRRKGMYWSHWDHSYSMMTSWSILDVLSTWGSTQSAHCYYEFSSCDKKQWSVKEPDDG